MQYSTNPRVKKDEKKPTALVAELSQCTAPMMDIAQVVTLFPRACCIRVAVADAGDAIMVKVTMGPLHTLHAEAIRGSILGNSQ